METKIRSIELPDAAAVSEIYRPFVADSATSFEVEAPDAAEIGRRIKDLTAQYPWLVFEADGKVVGYAYAASHRARLAYRWCTEVSVYLHEGARRRGVGSALYGALFEVLKRQGYVNAYAGITLPNAASVGLHRAVGFEPIGVYSRVGFKHGGWHDVVWLQFRLLETPEPINSPLPAPEVLADSRLASIFSAKAKEVRLGK